MQAVLCLPAISPLMHKITGTFFFIFPILIASKLGAVYTINHSSLHIFVSHAANHLSLRERECVRNFELEKGFKLSSRTLAL